MCGFTGYLLKDHAEQSTQTVLGMLQLQRHRGPDDQGIVAFNLGGKQFQELPTGAEQIVDIAANLLFGFNRLSILDLSQNGHQPMASLDHQVFLMMNGEIYNAFDLKPSLEQKGYHFRSSTDTEVVLNLYLEYGIKGMLQQLNGMFALAITDLRSGELYLARDRFGIKPLYVLQEGNRLAFSSEIKSFAALPGFNFELDNTNLNEFWLFRNLINRTLFKGIENIMPGSYWRISRNVEISKLQYYDLDQEGRVTVEAAPHDMLEATLRHSVYRQMIADVKLGCQLSGGVDSSLVTYYASEKVEAGKLETISIIPDEKGFSEEFFIDEAVAKLGVKAHKYPLSSEYYFATIEEVAWHFEQPINHPNTIGIYQLSQNAKRHVTVLLSGEGADEVLGGYTRFADADRLPLSTRSFWSRLKQNRQSLGQYFFPQLDSITRMILASTHTSIDAIRAVKEDFSLKEAIAYRQTIWGQLKGNQFLKQRKYEILTYLPDLLMRQDKMSMAHSIENRVPFLDNEMVELALSLDRSSLLYTKSGKIEPKSLLKKIAAEKFSHSFAYRPKQGFPIPIKKFMQAGSFQERWRELWRPGIINRGVIDVKNLDKWLHNLPATTTSQLDMIWMAVSFEIWAQKYL